MVFTIFFISTIWLSSKGDWKLRFIKLHFNASLFVGRRHFSSFFYCTRGWEQKQAKFLRESLSLAHTPWKPSILASYVWCFPASGTEFNMEMFVLSKRKSRYLLQVFKATAFHFSVISIFSWKLVDLEEGRRLKFGTMQYVYQLLGFRGRWIHFR